MIEKQKNIKQLTLRIPVETWKSAKISLVQKGMSFQSFLLEKLYELTKEGKHKPPHVG